MLQGSSAYRNEERKQVSTPAIRVSMLDNFNLVDYAGASGKAMETMSFTEIRDSIVFNNRYIVAGLSQRGFIYTFTKGFSLLTVKSLGITFTSAKFIIDGSTLHLLYTYEKQFVYRISSGNGASWGTATPVLVGATPNIVFDVSPVNADEGYLIGVRDTGEGTLQRSGDLVYYNLNDVGNGRQLNSSIDKLYLDSFSNTNFVVSKRVGDYDYIITRLLKDAPEGDRKGAIIKRYISDTYNILQEETLVDFGPNNDIDMHNIIQGSSYYYLPLAPYVYYYTIQGGVSVSQSAGFAQAFLRSPDMVNWSSPIFMTNFTTPRQLSMFIPGMSGDDYELLARTVTGTSRMQAIYKSTASVDLSDSIISYENSNNQRISLKLANSRYL